jgi:NAD(P)H-hydrate epimerase
MHPIPALTTDQMRKVDRLMIEEYHIDLLQMMENAGRNLALLAVRMLDGDVADRSVVVLAGRGNNGGGGLVAARHLLNWGAWVQLLLTHRPEEYSGVAAHQLSILQAMDAPLAWAEEGWELPPADLIIDAVIDYGLQGNPSGAAANLIALANSSVAPILSLDVPSGLDATTGQLYSPHIVAAATMTLALPKTGLRSPATRAAVGQLYLADIGVPPALYGRLGLDVPPLFAMDTIVPLGE